MTTTNTTSWTMTTKLNNEDNLLQKQLESFHNDLGRQVHTPFLEIARCNDPTFPPNEELENVEAALAPNC